MEQKAIIQEGIKHFVCVADDTWVFLGLVVITSLMNELSLNLLRTASISSATLTLLEISGFEAMCMLYFALCITFGPKKPSVICYTDEQIKLLITAIENGSVISVDRTFNLSSCYVTALLEISGFEAMCMLYFALCITFGPIMLSGFVLFACLLISRDGF
jgi:hypothetical protein